MQSDDNKNGVVLKIMEGTKVIERVRVNPGNESLLIVYAEKYR